MKRAMYPGTFDPITIGHKDVIARASNLFDEVVVVIMQNPNKNPLFTEKERLAMLNEVCKPYMNVSTAIGSGLTVDFAQKIHASVLIRGIRALMDYEVELQQATANMILNPKIETIFLLTRPEFSFMSSSAVKEIAKNNGDLKHFVPEEVFGCIQKKFKEKT
jgi:pantetheine-phosphate adenylyltransferase